MEKAGVWLTVLIIVLVLAGGLFIFNYSNSQGSASVSSNPQAGQQSNQVSTVETGSDSGNSNSVLESSSGTTKEFNVIAKKWEFVPGTITVNEGDTVILHITSTDVEHGFAIPEFGVNENLSPGKQVTVQFVADKKGTYTFFCNVYCGSGHSEMSGTLLVR